MGCGCNKYKEEKKDGCYPENNKCCKKDIFYCGKEITSLGLVKGKDMNKVISDLAEIILDLRVRIAALESQL